MADRVGYMDISIIIATYRMQREAPRTIFSALPPSQKAVQDIDYEVIVIDNGSPKPLDLEHFSSGEVSLRLIHIDPSEAEASPVSCINRAIAEESLGRHVLVCIDGARMMSPYLVKRTYEALENFPGSFTYVGSRHLGHEVQMKSVAKGYSQEFEDRLLDSVSWSDDLDDLWGISVWAGAHHQSNPFYQNESSAMGFSRELWDQLGGYNPGFRRPGGGLCNLELFKRTVEREQGLNILLLGEATFHQFHGGAATASAGYFTDSLREYEGIIGAKYSRPSYSFLADMGEDFGRFQTVHRYLNRNS